MTKIQFVQDTTCFEAIASHVLGLGDLMMQASSNYAAGQVSQFLEDGRVRSFLQPLNKSTFPTGELAMVSLLAPLKMAEFNVTGLPGGTPQLPRGDKYPFVSGFMGAVRFVTEAGDFGVAISGLPQEHDRLIALLLRWAIDHPLSFHHHGERKGEEKAYDTGVEALRGAGLKPMQADAPNHRRHYAPVYRPDGNLLYMKEVQWFPKRPLERGVTETHFDIATPDPEQMLHFLGKYVEAEPVEPDFFDDRPGPVGVVWAWSEKHQARLGIMARHWKDRNWVPNGVRHHII